jgi:hypothetical protein
MRIAKDLSCQLVETLRSTLNDCLAVRGHHPKCLKLLLTRFLLFHDCFACLNLALNLQEFLNGPRIVVIVCSTTGNGEPPDNARKFFTWLHRRYALHHLLRRCNHCVSIIPLSHP